MAEREHGAHFMQQTSMISYGEIRERGLGEAQRLVYSAIKSFCSRGKNPTDREVTLMLGFEDPNKVRPRRHELVAMGLVKEDDKRVCTVSGKLALTWRVSPNLDDFFFTEVGDMLIQNRLLPKNEWDLLRKNMADKGYRYGGDSKWLKKV